MTWRAPFAGSSAITSYVVAHSLAGANAWTEVASSGTGVSRTLTGLLPVTDYDVRVRAVNVVGGGDWSPIGSARTGAGFLYGRIAVLNTLAAVNPADASAIVAGGFNALGTADFDYLAFGSGTLYGLKMEGQLYTINISTGVAHPSP